MQKRILVPLDGSAMAERVLPYAVSLAKSMDAGLLLLEAVQPPVLLEPVIGAVPVTAGGWDAWESGPAEAREYLDEVAAQVQALGVEAAVQVRDEEPAKEIVGFVRDHPDIVMIAMATHARSGVGVMVFGSVAEKVLHEITKPVLLLHPAQDEREPVDVARPWPVRSILVPLDGSAFAERSLDKAVEMAQATGAGVTLVSVVHGSEGGTGDYLAEKAQEMAARTEGLKVETRLEQGHPTDGILHAADETHADLIVMATHGRNALQRLVVGSVALKVLHTARVPMLLVHCREEPAPPQERRPKETAGR